MTKAELVDAVLADAKVDLTKKAATDLVDAVFDNVGKAVKRERRFTYPGFGTFTVRQRKGRTGRNPRTGEEIKIKPSKTVGFKPAPALKERL